MGVLNRTTTNQQQHYKMKFLNTTILLAIGAGLTYAAPNPDTKSQFNQLFADTSSKAVNALQGYADNAGVGMSVQEKADAMMAAGEQFLNSKKPELNQCIENSEYAGQAKAFVAEATKIRNKNRNNSPAKILDNLTVKINGLAKKNIKNKSIKQNFVKLTKAMKEISKKSVNESDYANMKARNMWRDTASQMEAQVNLQIKNAQDQVDSI